MADNLDKVQAYVDQNTKRVLAEMGQKHLRGHNESRVVAAILENWVWDNQQFLKENGINLVAPEHKPSTT